MRTTNNVLPPVYNRAIQHTVPGSSVLKTSSSRCSEPSLTPGPALSAQYYFRLAGGSSGLCVCTHHDREQGDLKCGCPAVSAGQWLSARADLLFRLLASILLDVGASMSSFGAVAACKSPNTNSRSHSTSGNGPWPLQDLAIASQAGAKPGLASACIMVVAG